MAPCPLDESKLHASPTTCAAGVLQSPTRQRDGSERRRHPAEYEHSARGLTSQNENGSHQETSDGGVITLFPA